MGGFTMAMSGWFCTCGVWYDSGWIHNVGVVLDSHCTTLNVGIWRFHSCEFRKVHIGPESQSS